MAQVECLSRIQWKKPEAEKMVREEETGKRGGKREELMKEREGEGT